MVENSGYWKCTKKPLVFSVLKILYSQHQNKRAAAGPEPDANQRTEKTRPKQTTEMVFSFSGEISPFLDKEIDEKFGNSVFFFLVSVNSTNYGIFIVQIRKRIDTGKKKGIK